MVESVFKLCIIWDQATSYLAKLLPIHTICVNSDKCYLLLECYFARSFILVSLSSEWTSIANGYVCAISVQFLGSTTHTCRSVGTDSPIVTSSVIPPQYTSLAFRQVVWQGKGHGFHTSIMMICFQAVLRGTV